MIKRILLDIDDVCNRFTMTALHYVGCRIDPMQYTSFPPECQFDIVCAANKLLGYERFNVSDFWEHIPRKFWANAPPSAEFPLLIGWCESLVGQENVCLLTSPTIDPDCLAGKLEWIHQFAPRWLHRQYLVGPCKQFAAHPEALLIDDSDKNVNKFRSWGGQAVLVPRPWNTNHALNTMEHLAHAFELLHEAKREALERQFLDEQPMLREQLREPQAAEWGPP